VTMRRMKISPVLSPAEALRQAGFYVAKCHAPALS